MRDFSVKALRHKPKQYDVVGSTHSSSVTTTTCSTILQAMPRWQVRRMARKLSRDVLNTDTLTKCTCTHSDDVDYYYYCSARGFDAAYSFLHSDILQSRLTYSPYIGNTYKTIPFYTLFVCTQSQSNAYVCACFVYCDWTAWLDSNGLYRCRHFVNISYSKNIHIIRSSFIHIIIYTSIWYDECVCFFFLRQWHYGRWWSASQGGGNRHFKILFAIISTAVHGFHIHVVHID